MTLCCAANAGEAWTSVAPVEVVTVRIHWVSIDDLRAAARAVGKAVKDRPMAFSVLRKNPETGGYSCDIYIPHKPVRIWDEPTASLGHEITHCLGFSHE